MCGVGRLLARPRIGAQFTKCAAGASCMSEDVLKSNTRAGPDENNRLQVDVRFLDRERLGEVAGAAVTRGNFLKLRKLL